MEKPYILISNDDGISAPGLNFLVETLRPHADLLVVAPDGPRSGMSMSITSRDPLRYRKVEESEGLTRYSASGTPADCIKMALNRFIKRRPDLIIGGINHGDNSSVNAHYSGTMGVAIEGGLQGYPSVAFSLCNIRHDADFTPMAPYLVDLTFKAIAMGMPAMTCLNINFPDGGHYNGVKVCRMAHSRWVNEIVACKHPHGGEYFWMGGECEELEPEAEDTDRWALAHGYVAITPTTLDVTAYGLIDVMRSLL